MWGKRPCVIFGSALTVTLIPRLALQISDWPCKYWSEKCCVDSNQTLAVTFNRQWLAKQGQHVCMYLGETQIQCSLVYMYTVCLCTVFVCSMQYVVCSIQYAVLVYSVCIQCVCTVFVCSIQYVVCSIQYAVLVYNVCIQCVWCA